MGKGGIPTFGTLFHLVLRRLVEMVDTFVHLLSKLAKGLHLAFPIGGEPATFQHQRQLAM